MRLSRGYAYASEQGTFACHAAVCAAQSQPEYFLLMRFARGQTLKLCLLVMRLTVEPAEMTIVESFRLVVESPINLTQIHFSGDEQPWMNLEI